MTQPITLSLTPTEAEALCDLLHWTNDPQFTALIKQIEGASAGLLTEAQALTPQPTTQTNRKD